MGRILRIVGSVGVVVFSLTFPSLVMSQTTVSVGSEPVALAIDPLANQAVVTHKGSQDLWIIDLATQNVLSSISLNTRPGEIALDPANHIAIVILKKLDSILIIDLATHMEVATIPVGRNPEGIAIDSITQQAVVTNEKDDTISIVDLRVRSVVATLPVGRAPKGVAIHPESLVAVVANEKDDSLTFIDLNTRSPIATLTVPEKPQAVAIHPGRHEAVITHEKGDQISLIDLSYQTLIRTLPVGKSPHSVVINPNTQQALVLNKKDDSLTLVDLVTATVLGHLPLGKNPEGIDIQPDTNLLVVVNKKDDTLSLIDLNTAILTTPVPAGKDPRGIGIETDTDLAVVANKKDDTISLISLPAGRLLATLSVGKDPEGVAVDSLSNKALITNKKENTVSIIDLRTQSLAATLPVGKDPHGVAINPNTQIAVVANKKDDTISIIDLSTLTVQSTIPVGRDPLGVAIDSLANQAWVTQEKDDSVTVIDLGTGTVITTLLVGKKPQRIAIDPVSNQAVVTNKKDNTISIIDLATRSLIATLPVGKDPIGVAIHPDTLEVFVVNHHDNTVSIVDLATQQIMETLAVGKRPREIAIHPGLNIAVVTNEGDDSVSILQLGGTPAITGFSPTQGPPGTVVTLTGENFDTVPSNNSVFFFNNVAATVLSASATSMAVIVPTGVVTGPLTITTSSGSATSTQNFDVENPSPTLSSITPTSGKVGTPVTIIGLNFDPTPSNNTLTFNGKTSIITSATTTQITTTVPQGATSGPITVTTPTGAASSAPFTVILSEDFLISASPLSINVVPGESAALQVNLLGAGEDPYSGLVGLSVGALPLGVTSFFSPSIGQTGQSSFLNIFTPGTLAPGAYPVTVQAQAQIDGQIIARAVTFTLNVLADGTTSLSGQILSSDTGRPLADILVKNGANSITTDAAGHFFFSSFPAGTQLLLVDGTPAGTAEVAYPIDLPVQVKIAAGTANVLPYPVYLHEVNTKHVTSLDTSLGDVIVSDPEIPGFELSIPQGVQIIGWDGLPNTQMSIKSVPIDRLPLPPIDDTTPTKHVYMFHFFKAGGGTPTQVIPVKYPNDAGLPPGTVVDLYYYDEEPVADPTSHQWKKFGTGTVSSDARQIVSDPGVGIPKFCCGGTFFTWLFEVLSGEPTPDNPPEGGDPVNLSTGTFGLKKTDMVLPGIIPIQFTRYYTARRELLDSATPGPFGPGTNHNYNHRLVPFGNSGEALLLLKGDDGRAPFSINPDGTFTNATTPSLKGAVVSVGFDGGRTLHFKDGRRWIFSSTGFLTRIEDRNGNGLDLIRAGAGLLTQIIQPDGRVIQLTYDGLSHITHLSDPLGRVVQYSYDSDGMLNAVTDPEGGVTRYAYDRLKRMATLTDARGILFLTNEYDRNDRVVTQTNADGGIFQFFYFGPGGRALLDVPEAIFLLTSDPGCGPTVVIDAGTPPPAGRRCVIRVVQPGLADRLVTQAVMIDPEGSPTSYRFNSAGYPIEITDTAGKTTFFERAIGTNELLSTTDPLDRQTRFTYDNLNNLLTTTDPDGNVTTFAYEPTVNRIASITDALSQVTSFTYDAKGNMLSTTDPSGAVSNISYTLEGQPKTVTDPLGNVTQFNYDLHGNLNQTIDPLGNTTARAYDPVSRLMTVTDPRGLITGFVYDDLNRVTTITDPGAGITRFSYDENGNLLTVIDANSNTTTYAYDVQDRLATRIDPLLRMESYAYDLSGNLTTFTDRKGQVTAFTYDPLNRRVRTNYADNSQTTFTYDTAGRLNHLDESASSIVFSYDNLDRLASELTPQGVVSYTYDVLGRRAAMSVNGDLPVNYQYDTNSRLTQVAQGSEVVGLNYDLAGRRTTLSYPNGTSTSYTYDTASRLTNITHQAGLTPFESITYTYDAAGNRISLDRTNGASILLPDAVQAAYDAANGQIKFNSTTPNLSYDANGNLTSQTDASGTTTYTWDARNRLLGINGPNLTASFVYNALGRRTSKTINGLQIDYQYDGNDIISEIGGGAVGASYLRSLSIDEPFVRQSSSNEYYHVDALGSTFELTDEAGAVTTTYEYEAFGSTIITGTSSNPFQYTGRENDGTGLYYYRARYYSGSLQRFISQDSIRFGDFNLYAYVKNQPIRYFDPWGLAYFAKRPLNPLSFMVNNPVDDKFNTELSHEQLFFEDGQPESNLGFFEDGRVKEDPHFEKYRDKYQRTGPHFDDELMRDAIKEVEPKSYCIIGNNCQDWADKVREKYKELEEERNRPPCLSIGGRKPRSC